MKPLLLLLAICCAASGFTVSWDASPDPTVIGYRVYYGTASGNYTTTIDAGTATSVRITDPPTGVTYYAVVTAYAAGAIESLPSNEVSYSTLINWQETIAVDSRFVPLGQWAGEWTPDLAKPEWKPILVPLRYEPEGTVNWTFSATGALVPSSINWTYGQPAMRVTVRIPRLGNTGFARLRKLP